MFEIKNTLSQHPWDWLCHFALCFIPVYFGWATWFVVLTVGIIIEYEQKTQVCYNDKTWREYLLQDSLGDLIANSVGIVGAIIIRGLI